MTSRIRLIQFFTVALLICSAALPAQAYALEDFSSIPNLHSFIESVNNGDSNALRGVYVQDVMAYPIVQQPYGNTGYVSRTDDTVTQFSLAAQKGVVGLLAHNNLAGDMFDDLKYGDEVVLVYGDGHTERFLVKQIDRYQIVQAGNLNGNYINLETGATESALEIFNRVYAGEYHVTLQTCIENQGNLSWGRLFIVAYPIPDKLQDGMTLKVFYRF